MMYPHYITCMLIYEPLQNHLTDFPQADGGLVSFNFVGGSKEVEPVLMQLDRKEKMTYTEQAAKRKHCQRLTR